MFTNDCKCKLYVLNLHHIRTITKQNDKMTTISTIAGISFHVALATTENQIKLVKLRKTYNGLLSVDSILVSARYNKTHDTYTSNRDFDNTQLDYEYAEIEALNEAIAYAKNLEDNLIYGIIEREHNNQSNFR